MIYFILCRNNRAYARNALVNAEHYLFARFKAGFMDRNKSILGKARSGRPCDQKIIVKADTFISTDLCYHKMTSRLGIFHETLYGQNILELWKKNLSDVVLYNDNAAPHNCN